MGMSKDHANISHNRKLCSTPHACNSSCLCSTTHMKSTSHGDRQVACIMPGSVPAALSAHPCIQGHTFVNLVKMPLHFQTVCWPKPRPPPPTAAVTCDATSVMDIGNARHALACGWVDCLDAFRPARPAKV
eukprot:364068-Chlamydomonas_euryale.AAC.12